MKHHKPILLLFFFFFFINASGIAQQSTRAKNSPVDVEQLLSQMTIEEKVGQMTQVTIDLILKDNSATEIDPAKLRTAIIDKKVGSILNTKGHAYTVEQWHTIANILALGEKAYTESPHLYGKCKRSCIY